MEGELSRLEHTLKRERSAGAELQLRLGVLEQQLEEELESNELQRA